MKYRNRSDNYYDTEKFKSNTIEGSVTKNIASIVISKKIVRQANKYLSIYNMCKHSRYILLALFLISPYLLVLPIISTLLCMYMKTYSKISLVYKINNIENDAFQKKLEHVKRIMKSKKISWVRSKSKVFESRYEAGAGTVWDTVPCRIVSIPPFPFSTNMKIISIQSTNESVTFFPDRIVIISDGHIADIPYDGINYEYEDFDFIENEKVPNDAIIVGHTWLYVNNDGSPDRRFKNNRQLPICGYGKLMIKSKSGLNVILIFSNRKLWDNF